MEAPEVKCPKCGSTQLSANKKGFSGKNAVTGAVLTGGIGLLAGTIGSNKIMITCLNCGTQFRPGGGGGNMQSSAKPQWKTFDNIDYAKRHRTNKIIYKIFFIVLAVIFGLPGLLALICDKVSTTAIVLVVLAAGSTLAAIAISRYKA